LLKIQTNCQKGLEGKFNWIHSNLGQWHRVHSCLMSFYHNFKQILRYHVYKNE
jgi:hypothetical protein